MKIAIIIIGMILTSCVVKRQNYELSGNTISPGEMKGLQAIDKHLRAKLFDQSILSQRWSLALYMGKDLSRFKPFLGSWQNLGLRNKYTGQIQNPFNLMIWWITVSQFADKASLICESKPVQFVKDLNDSDRAIINLKARDVFEKVCTDATKESLRDLWLLYVDPYKSAEAEKFAELILQQNYSSPKEVLKEAIVVMSFHPLFLIHRG